MTSYLDEPDAGARIMRRCDELAAISEPGEGVTRLYLTPEHRRAAALLERWMTEAGMETRIDEAGNVVGRYHADSGGGPYLIAGSHMDSVIDGGRYDGPLGILTALDCVAVLDAAGRRFPFGIEVVAFGDEEGTRFRTTLAGSGAVAGCFDAQLLEATDANGVTMREAMAAFGLDPDAVFAARHAPDDVAGYVEVHIEQGPVLEAENLPVGVVSAISGQTRAQVTLQGVANHAGTVPMALRRDPLLAASEIALAAEAIARARENTVATVGVVRVEPGAVNVIPGTVSMTLDLRARDDGTRASAWQEFQETARRIAARRGVDIRIDLLLDLAACHCAPAFVRQFEEAVSRGGFRPVLLPSGAGHDGMAMARLTDIGMLFVRCKGGFSHSPAESVEAGDVAAGAAILLSFLENFHPKEQ